jgi:hypothetical protein
VQRLEKELDRLISAIRAGMDPTLAAPQTREIQSRIAQAQSVIERSERSHQRVEHLTEADVRAVLGDTREMIQLIRQADRIERAVLYQALNLSLRYESPVAAMSWRGRDLRAIYYRFGRRPRGCRVASGAGKCGLR